MSREGADLVREMYVAFHGGDAERTLSFFAEDVEVDATARVDGGVGRGRDELARVIGEWVGAFDDWRDEIEEIRDLGEKVFVVALQSGRERATGLSTQMRYAVIYEVRDGAINRMELQRDRPDALGPGTMPE